jgi:hypothetical protein
MNRWLANKVGTNSNNMRDSLVSSHMIMFDCVPNNINIRDYVPIKANKLPGIITSGKSNHCRFGVACVQDGKKTYARVKFEMDRS